MPARTEIGWADYSSNPLKARANGKQGWSCAMVSAECAHCYAATLNNRFGTQLPFNAKGVADSEHYLEEKELRHILSFRPKGPFKNGRTRPIVFPFDMTDVFGDWVKFEMIDKCFAAFALRPDVDFMVLTKRAERMAEYVGDDPICRGWAIGKASDEYGGLPTSNGYFGPTSHWQWPLPNVWLGVSVGVKATLHRIDTLREIPAALRFVSFEPLLEDLGEVNLKGIGLGITGGESGHGARQHDIDWSWNLGEQCQAAGACWFHKQHGSNAWEDERLDYIGTTPVKKVNGLKIEVEQRIVMTGGGGEPGLAPMDLKDKSGSNPAEWGDGWLQQMPNTGERS